MRKRTRLLALGAALAVVAAACSSDHEAVTTTTGPEATTTTAAFEDPLAVALEAGLASGLEGYSIDEVAWNGYWYSRYNLGNLAMMSGLGVTFEPPMEAVMSMAMAVDQGAEDGEHVVMPQNAALLQAVYAGGNPEFVNSFNGEAMDFTNWRWDEAQMDTRLLPAAQAQTIIKEVEWAKLFNNGGWAGSVTDDFGAMDRFKGMALFASAKMQSTFALQNLRNEDGMFVAVSRFVDGAVIHENPSVEIGDQYQMLQALSDVRLTLQHPEDFNGVYADDDTLAQLGPAIDEFFSAVAGLEPATILELGLGAQAMVWFAASTADAELRAQALELLEHFGDELAAAEPSGAVENAEALRGLIEAARILNDTAHWDAAADTLAVLLADYQPATGSFDGVTGLTTWEVGDILGALNAARLNLVDSRTPAEQALAGFFEATINRSGLMRAVIPKQMEASPFEIERLTNDVYFAYPGIPTPDAAGGPNGTAAVDAAAIAFDGTAWTVSDAGFNTASTMHASNEMFWIWGFQNGFISV